MGIDSMFTTIAKLLKNEDGATAIEYGLIAALISIAAVAVMGHRRHEPQQHVQHHRGKALTFPRSSSKGPAAAMSPGLLRCLKRSLCPFCRCELMIDSRASSRFGKTFLTTKP